MAGKSLNGIVSAVAIIAVSLLCLTGISFDDSDGNRLDYTEIAGHDYKINGEEGTIIIPPENNDNGIALIAGIAIAVLAIVGIGAFFLVRKIKQ